jgi:hypothetical protein
MVNGLKLPTKTPILFMGAKVRNIFEIIALIRKIFFGFFG